MKLKVRDVFSIPIDKESFGSGQIINIPDKSSLIIVIFDKLWNNGDIQSLQEICKSDILFLGYTLDAKLYHKHWLILGNYSDNIGSVYLPYYKLGTPPEDISILNFKGDLIRPATISEFDELEYQSIVSPIRYENALKAHFNLAEWNAEYDQLLYSYTLDSIAVVERDKNRLRLV